MDVQEQVDKLREQFVHFVQGSTAHLRGCVIVANEIDELKRKVSDLEGAITLMQVRSD